MSGTPAETGGGTTVGTRAGADDEDEDEERLEELAPPPPLVNLPTDVTEAERAEVRSAPYVTDEVVRVESRFSSHSAI